MDLAADLFDAPAEIFSALTVAKLLLAALLRQPDRFATHLRRALDGPEPAARRAGQVWANAFALDALPDQKRNRLVSTLSELRMFR